MAHEARADADGIAAFALQRLDPATRYEYRVEVEGAAPLTGAFRTFGEGAWSFRIAFSACAETGSASPVFDAIRDARPDLFIHTGDIHYEDITRNEPERFRRAFDWVMSSPTQSRLYRSVPIAYTWTTTISAATAPTARRPPSRPRSPSTASSCRTIR